jgi:hypothetical protein
MPMKPRYGLAIVTLALAGCWSAADRAAFKFGIEGYGAVGPGFWFVIPERALTGSIKLSFYSDLDYCFRRV